MSISLEPWPTTFDYVDARGVDIVAYRWDPTVAGVGSERGPGVEPIREQDPVAAVQISHGIGEHARRYDAFAGALASAGFVVYADDHRGHGETGRAQYGGDLSRLGHLGPGGMRAAEDAIRQLTGIVRDEHPGLPVVMFAHSWGSLMAQRILETHPQCWDALVLSGTAYRTLRHMESGNLGAKWKTPGGTGFEWLSRDPAVGERFVADPLCFDANVMRLFGAIDGLRLFGRPHAGLPPELPILIASGSDDPLNRGDGIHRLAEAYRRCGVSDVTVKVYQGARHEILNETNRDEVFSDIVTWILERVASD